MCCYPVKVGYGCLERAPVNGHLGCGSKYVRRKIKDLLMESYIIQLLCLIFLIISHKNSLSLGDRVPGLLQFKIWVGILIEWQDIIQLSRTGCVFWKNFDQPAKTVRYSINDSSCIDVNASTSF